MRFHGDIIITDPCYVIRDNNDWHDCAFGDELDVLGFTAFLTCDCMGNIVTDTDSGAVLGEFCSDSCVVSVMLLSELLAYHPAALDSLGDYCYTILRDFDGTIEREKAEDAEPEWAFVGRGSLNFRTDRKNK